MSEHKIKAGDKVFLPLEATEVNHRGVVYCTYNANEAGLGWWPASALVPADNLRTLTPIAPEDVREGDVVRMEWEDFEGPHAREGAAYVSALGDLCVENTSVDILGRTVYLISRATTERDKWWPPQPGDTISDGVGRVTRGKSDEWRLNPDHPDFYRRQTQVLWTDADVPDDAVLLLPAQTREATS